MLGKQAPGLLVLKDLISPHLQQLPWFCVTQCQQASLRVSLPADLGVPHLQQLPWLLKAHAPKQVDLRTSAALWAPDNSNLLVLLPQRYLQLDTQHYITIKEQELQPLTEGRKEVTGTTVRTLQGVTCLRNTARAPGIKNSKPQLPGHKRLKP
jgi:hypothetical protein